MYIRRWQRYFVRVLECGTIDVPGWGWCNHHCTVFRSHRSGTPVTANLRKRICERILHSRIPAVLVVVEGDVCTLWSPRLWGFQLHHPWLVRFLHENKPGKRKFGYFVPRGSTGPQRAWKLGFLKVKKNFFVTKSKVQGENCFWNRSQFLKLREHGPKKTKFQNWQHPKLKIFKIWIDTWIPFIFLIKKHPWLQFCVWIWWNCRLLLFTTSEAQRYPWAQNIKISFYQAYFHAKI